MSNSPVAPEIAAFLDSHRRAFLVTLTPRDTPVAHPMSLTMDAGSMYFYTYRKSAKVRNLERDPRVSCLVATADDAVDFAAIEVRGTAVVVPVDDLPETLLNHHTAGASDVPASEQIRDARERLASGRRVYVRVDPDFARSCGELAPPLPDPTGGVEPAVWPDEVPQSARARAIAMTAEEATTCLTRHSIAAFATLGADGHPVSVPARDASSQGSVLLAVRSDDPALDNLRTRHAACATVEEFPTYDAIKGLMLQGVARPTMGDEWGADVAQALDASFAAVTLDVERPVTFDFAKLSRGANV